MRLPFVNKFQSSFVKKSYAQCGEDLIVRHVFNMIGIERPSYWDIGAYHPFNISNTAYFYERGCRGVNIEPNPDSFSLFKKYRRHDVNLNAGVSSASGQGTYYKLDVPALNTFSKSDAESAVKEGHVIKEQVTIPLITPSEISKKHFNNRWPEFLSLDVEGLDLEILRAIDYANDSLLVLCIESVNYKSSGFGGKNNALIDFLLAKGYMLYADTYINSIFVRRNAVT